MKYIDADRLIAEIERRRDGALERQKNLEKIGQETVLNEMIAFELNRLISFIDSLQQEQPDFPITDEEVEKALASIQKVELPDKYKTPDWLFKQPEQPVQGLEEEIINNYFKDWKFDDELDIMVKPNNYSVSFSDLRDIAKHFYELGLNARK